MLSKWTVATSWLTFRFPDRDDDFVVDAVDDGADDDGRQRRLGDEGAEGHEDNQSKQNDGTRHLEINKNT